MARRFRGSETFKVDAKGRVSIPASFRRVIEACDPDWQTGARPQILIVSGPKTRRYLEVFTMEAVYEIDEQIEAMQRGSQARKDIERLMYEQSYQTEIDGDGRLVLPQKFREQIGLKGEAYFASAGTSFKIWDPETRDATEAQADAARSAELPEDYDPLIHLPPKGGA